MPNSAKSAIERSEPAVCEVHGVPLRYRHDPMQSVHECPVCRPRERDRQADDATRHDPIARGI